MRFSHGRTPACGSRLCCTIMSALNKVMGFNDKLGKALLGVTD
jgi:hypothetical protein